MDAPPRELDVLGLVLRMHESASPAEAFRAMVQVLAAEYPLRAARWALGGERGHWPEDDADAERMTAPPGRDHLFVVPVEPGRGELRFLMQAGAPSVEWDLLSALGRVFGGVAERARARAAVEGEREELRRRIEESEALHVLGLAANRTLDPDEVLTLVARSTRSLLGAQYVTVSTAEVGDLRVAAAVGLRGEPESDPFAARVIAAGKPLTLGDGGEPIPDGLGFHSEEGVRTALGVPLSLFGEIFGALVVGYRRPYPLLPRDTRLALTLAGHAAVAISNARLHREVADRSAALERAAEAKERFFASLSHEMRTPLNAVLGYQSLLLDDIAGQLPPRAREFLSNAQRATQSLLVLINDVLDLSKLDAGKVELTVRPVEIRWVVLEALDTVRPLADRKGLRIRSSVAPTGPPLVTDPDRVRQILINLLSNAIKFTPQGEVSLEAEAEAGPGGRWLVVRVRDTGPGIPEGDRERIFHEFEQVAGTASVGGTGLGLAISRKLARLLGGDIQLESGVPRGACFVLRLPELAR